MEKRILVFVVLATAVILGHLALVQYMNPPRPKPKDLAEQPQDADDGAPKEPPAKPEPDEAPAVAKPAPAKEEKPEDQGEPAPEKPKRSVLPQRRATLGSYAAGSPYASLYTFNSQGAALERVELTERTEAGRIRYRDLERRGGYFGELALDVEPNGLRVNVVGPGTPAVLAKPRQAGAGAGIRVGDVLTKVDEQTLRDTAELATHLDGKRPGEIVALTLLRDVNGEAESLVYEVQLDVRPLEFIRPEPLTEKETVPHPLSFLFSLVQLGSRELDKSEEEFAGLPSLRNSNWDLRELDDPYPGVEFRFTLDAATLKPFDIDGDLEIVKRYRLAPSDQVAADAENGPLHHLQIEIELHFSGPEPLPVAYRLDGPNGLPLEGWWYLTKIHTRWFAGAGARDILYRTAGEGQRLIGCSEIYKYADKNPKTPDKPLFAEGDEEQYRTLQYIGVDTQFFLAALLPKSEGDGRADLFDRASAVALGDLSAKEKRWMKTTNTTFKLISPLVKLQPGEPLRQDFLLYAGPKDTGLLAEYGLADCIYYGWFWFVAKPLSRLLHFFYAIVGNYGLAIIMLTVLVRGCMFPISRKVAKNAAMMQELAPEMRRIAEKYKNDMQKRGQAQQELFRSHNYNPFGGCWLMFLQLPIFIGLYRSLAVDIELRQAPLVPGISWCSNLAGPDMLYNWQWFMPSFLVSETGMLGPYFNLLPLFTIALFLVHQQMFTPPATDEQTRLQMKMMKFMTLFIGVLFFKVASGLCLYFIASSLWSVAERVLLPKPKKPAESPEPKAKPTPRSGESKASDMLARWFPTAEPNGSKNRPRPKNDNADGDVTVAHGL